MVSRYQYGHVHTGLEDFEKTLVGETILDILPPIPPVTLPERPDWGPESRESQRRSQEQEHPRESKETLIDEEPREFIFMSNWMVPGKSIFVRQHRERVSRRCPIQDQRTSRTRGKRDLKAQLMRRTVRERRYGGSQPSLGTRVDKGKRNK